MQLCVILNAVVIFLMYNAQCCVYGTVPVILFLKNGPVLPAAIESLWSDIIVVWRLWRQKIDMKLLQPTLTELKVEDLWKQNKYHLIDRV